MNKHSDNNQAQACQNNDNTTQLSPQAYDKLTEILDNPPAEPTDAMKELMSKPKLQHGGTI
ncbi:DUF1778 domain-containing protein [Vibrio splendidus]|nr:DUF1778 domain-containing protein [Vibrio splendidus]MCC4883039.1 DUF1778 domain-containing protein [Vibrio splendidus]